MTQTQGKYFLIRVDVSFEVAKFTLRYKLTIITQNNPDISEKGAEEPEEEIPPVPQGPPEPEPGSEDWEYVDQAIDVVCFF